MVADGFQGKLISKQRPKEYKGVNQANSTVTTTLGEGRVFPMNGKLFKELEGGIRGTRELAPHATPLAASLSSVRSIFKNNM